MDKEKIKLLIDTTMEEIDKENDPVEYTVKLTAFLSKLHPSDGYVIIRDTVIPAKNKRIIACKNADVTKYQEFQDIRLRCKESFEHDKSWATNLDVDKAVSKSYGITMRTLRAVMDLEQDRFDKVTMAINKIEEHLGLDVTDFREGDNNDSTEYEDAQNVEGITTEAGEPCETE